MITDYYGEEQNERRRVFNKIINNMNLVLMNNIVDVDPSIWDNWQGEKPIKDREEIFQWFAVNDNDADYLRDHNQYITYSNVLDTYFLAITHFGTGWDHVDSMVDDILGDKA